MFGQPTLKGVRTVWLRLKLDPTDELYKPTRLTQARPDDLADDEIAIGGVRRGWGSLDFGIENTPWRPENVDGKKARVELRVLTNGKARVASFCLVDDEEARPATAAD